MVGNFPTDKRKEGRKYFMINYTTIKMIENDLFISANALKSFLDRRSVMNNHFFIPNKTRNLILNLNSVIDQLLAKTFFLFYVDQYS